MTTTTTTTPTTTLTIDPVHSEMTFQVRHLVTKVRGRFNEFSGTIRLDEAQPERSSVELTIKTASISTQNEDRDKHLRSDDFFAADTHPQIAFRSTRIVKTGDEAFDVTGDLTMRGVTKAITLPVTHLGKAKDPWGGERYGFESAITLNRKHYGISFNAALDNGGLLLGEDVKITINIEAVAS
ncbi:MAG TPA: YceI family protein [Vicinamibacterales bacterium]|nr:YceI family protein [Vicinamibacterales bacterium]